MRTPPDRQSSCAISTHPSKPRSRRRTPVVGNRSDAIARLKQGAQAQSTGFGNVTAAAFERQHCAPQPIFVWSKCPDAQRRQPGRDLRGRRSAHLAQPRAGAIATPALRRKKKLENGVCVHACRSRRRRPRAMPRWLRLPHSASRPVRRGNPCRRSNREPRHPRRLNCPATRSSVPRALLLQRSRPGRSRSDRR